jgi:hypothetical protein
MNNDLERIRKESVVALFLVLSRHLPGGIEENHENLSMIGVSGSRFEPRTSA